MPQSLLIIGTEAKWEEKEIFAAAKRKGHTVKILDPKKIEIRLDKKGTNLSYEQRNITNLFLKSKLIFRRTRGAQDKMVTLALIAKNRNIPFTDTVECIFSNLNKSIFMPTITAESIAHVPTFFFSRKEDFSLQESGLTLPIIVKPAHGRHGEGIKIIKTESRFEKFFAQNKKEILVQDFLDIEEEYRVFVVGNRALGAIKKIPKKGKRIANISAGAIFEKVQLPMEYLKESKMLCKNQGIDIGGVDLAKVGNKYFLLEINRCPEFYGFSNATNIDVASRIVDFILKKT